jgi:hypothetical protein
LEEHHVVPQAWQRFWRPDDLDNNRTLGERQGHALGLSVPPHMATVYLWDKRTMTLCPTCHRNVHHIMVTLMRASVTNDPLDAMKAVFKGRRRSMVQDIAYTGLCRYRQVGGDLRMLREAGLWGNA